MATLVYSDADGVDRSFSLGAEPVLVGRAAECAIRSEDPRVSRMHARFFNESGALWVEDLGSSNGVYVGANKVQRSPVPTGEIVLVGSLMIRLMPPSGTLPPPMGLHGTLAHWLDLERKTRAAVEDERDALAKRVGELHDELRPLRDGQGAANDDAAGLRVELDQVRRATAHELEAIRVDLVKAREAKMIAETSAGMTIAERLAESDMTISGLQHQLELAKAAAGAGAIESHARELADELAAAVARADQAEKGLAAAQIRAQGAERNFTSVNTQAAKSEAKAAELADKLAEALAQRTAAEVELAALREKAAAFELRAGAGDAPIAAAEARSAKLAPISAPSGAELAELTAQLETRRARIVELEDAAVAADAHAAQLAEADKRARTELAARDAALAAAVARATDLESRLRRVSGADELAAARKERDDAQALAMSAEAQISAASARTEQSEKRAVAADTMAKAMAKDVAEALRRAVDADSRARAVARELDGAHRAAANSVAAEARATEAETKLAALQRDIPDQLEQGLRELTDKLARSQRELAAERSTAMTLVDRKIQLERELATIRTAGPRAEAAESEKYEAQIVRLEARIRDLEGGIAVEQTVSRSAATEARENLQRLEDQLAEANAAAKTATLAASALEQRLAQLEGELAGATEAHNAASAELDAARGRLAELEHVGSQADRANIDALAAKAEAADLAIGRAGALQLQLDEALHKLSYLERDAGAGDGTEPRDARIAELEASLRDTDSHKEAYEAMVRDAEARTREAQIDAASARDHAAQLEAYARNVDARTAEVEARAKDIEARAKDIEARAKEVAERSVDAERRARDSQAGLAEVERRARAAETQLAQQPQSNPDAVARIAQLENEIAAAENVRQFAANTEREIAQLQRELREIKSQLTQVTLERDRLESALRDARDDSETRNRNMPAGDPGHVDLSRYTELVARTAELEQKVVKMEHEDEKLRRQVSDAQAKLAEARAKLAAQEDGPTTVGSVFPIAFGAQLEVLEEAIDSLRANMRAASDETAIMDQSQSVIAIASAVSAAAEHVERARDSLRALSAMVDKP